MVIAAIYSSISVVCSSLAGRENGATARITSRQAPVLLGRSADEPITHASFRQQMPRARGVVLDFLAQVGHVHAHVVSVFRVTWPSHGFEQLLVRDDAIRLRNQVGEQLVFDGREVQGFAAIL